MRTDTTKRDCVCPLAKHKHGTPSGYWADSCRCFPCRIAYDRHVYRQRHGQPTTSMATVVDATATRRRLEALHALGWSGADIGARLGVGYSAVNQLRRQRSVYPRTADRVAAIYDELWATPSTGPQALRVARWAARSGFLLPLAWDDDTFDLEGETFHVTDSAPVIVDEVAVERAMHGDTACATRREVSEAIRILTSMGYSAADIADRLGFSQRTIVRNRTAA